MLSHNETVKYFLPGILYLVKALASNNATASVIFIHHLLCLECRQQVQLVSGPTMLSEVICLHLGCLSLAVSTYSQPGCTHPPQPKELREGTEQRACKEDPKNASQGQGQCMGGKARKREKKGRGGSQTAKSERTSSSPLTPHPGPISLHIQCNSRPTRSQEITQERAPDDHQGTHIVIGISLNYDSL